MRRSLATRGILARDLLIMVIRIMETTPKTTEVTTTVWRFAPLFIAFLLGPAGFFRRLPLTYTLHPKIRKLIV
jgi:hypothetical protein